MFHTVVVVGADLQSCAKHVQTFCLLSFHIVDSAANFWCRLKTSNEPMDTMIQDTIISILEGAIIKLAATVKWRAGTHSGLHIQRRWSHTIAGDTNMTSDTCSGPPSVPGSTLQPMWQIAFLGSCS